MQADESPKWVNSPTPPWFYVGGLLFLLGVIYVSYRYSVDQLFGTEAVMNAAHPVIALLASFPLIGAELADPVRWGFGILLVSAYCMILLLGFLFISSVVSSNPQAQTDEWVFVSPVEIPHEPWQTLVIDLPDRPVLPTFIALEVLLRTPVDLSSPSLLDDRTVTRKPIYPNYDIGDSKTMAQLYREEIFDPRLWTGAGIESTYDPRFALPSYELAPLGYESLRIDRSRFEHVLDVARRVPLENHELPSVDATPVTHDIALDDQQFTEMKDARMQLDALEYLLLTREKHIRFE